jgi:hypothetical protein
MLGLGLKRRLFHMVVSIKMTMELRKAVMPTALGKPQSKEMRTCRNAVHPVPRAPITHGTHIQAGNSPTKTREGTAAEKNPIESLGSGRHGIGFEC